MSEIITNTVDNTTIKPIGDNNISNDGSFKLIISCKLDGINEINLELDTCTTKQIKSSSTIASQPLQGGYVMSDHMYRNANEFGVSGRFSLHGYKSNLKEGNDYKFSNMFPSTDRLTRIQETFEYIKDNGILCDLTTLSNTQGGSLRFKKRTNMALQSISWTEYQNYMDYQFSFKEIICVEVQHYEGTPYEDGNPTTDSSKIMSLGTYLNNNMTGTNYAMLVCNQLIYWNYIKLEDARTINSNNNLITNETYKPTLLAISQGYEYRTNRDTQSNVDMTSNISNSDYKANFAGGLGGGVVAGAAIGSFFGFPIGTLIGAGIGSIVGSMVGSIKSSVDYSNHISEKQFKLLLDEKIQSNFIERIYYPEVSRLKELLENTTNSLINKFQDTVFYSISDDENDNNERIISLSIDDTYYYLKFKKDNTKIYDENHIFTMTNSRNQLSGIDSSTYDIYWNIEIQNQENKSLSSGEYGQCINQNKWTYITNFTECNPYTNSLFISKSGNYEIYLYYVGDTSTSSNQDDSNQNLYNFYKERNSLSNYYIIVTTGGIVNQIKKVTQELSNALGELGYY